MSEFPIGIFDSGVGGLSVLKEISRFLPHENLIYFSDNLNSPYGNKSSEELDKICFNNSMRARRGLVHICRRSSSITIRTLHTLYRFCCGKNILFCEAGNVHRPETQN